MSAIFLDPNLYCYSQDEWIGGEALDRLSALLDLLTEVEMSGERLEAQDVVSYILPDEVLIGSYGINPTVNTPPNDHYFRLFISRIMPILERRKARVAAGKRPEDCIGDSVEIADCVLREDLQAFLGQANSSEMRRAAFVYHPQRVSLILGSDVFFEEVSIGSVNGRYFLDHLAVYPLEKRSDPLGALSEAVSIKHARVSRGDPAWQACNVSPLFLHDDFVPSIARADFRNFVPEYRERIIYAILQIAAGRDVTISEHRMVSQTVAYNNSKHGKWNAYVFQMGPNPTDTRCSRLYYAKIAGGVLLFRFEEDAHP